MRDIMPPLQEDPRPEKPPRPRGARLWGGGTRRHVAAITLAVVLGIATLAAAAGTIVASVRGLDGSLGLSDFPFDSLLGSISAAYHRVSGVAGSGIDLVKTGQDLLGLVPDLAQGKRGDEALALLARAEGQLATLGDSNVPGLGARADDLAASVSGLRAWLTAVPERHVAIVLGNSAEMRAGGGFIGSYADVTIAGGAFKSAVVRDITEADRASGDHTRPPQALEPIADRWRAADANWFLSGPDSGAAFLTLLNRSPLYKDAPVDAVVFIAPRLVSTLLAVTGPVTVGDLTVDSDTFLRDIQEEVQEGQAAGADAPKAVLADLAPAFAEKLLGAATGDPLEVAAAIGDALGRRDIVVFARDEGFENTLTRVGVTGALYPTDDAFVGGYAAVAPSTIGGDKTDGVTTEDVRVREQLLPQGLVETTVEVERTHGGTDDDPWWYQEEHRSYVKVYAPLGAQPTAASGLWLRQRDPATYGASFTEYPLLAAVERSRRTYDAVPGVEAFVETGKEVFGFWQRTARGTGTVASVTYARELPHALRAGDAYTFVLERQPASSATYAVELFAPPGLVWAENGTTRYLFRSDDPSGRTVLKLTLADAS